MSIARDIAIVAAALAAIPLTVLLLAWLIGPPAPYNGPGQKSAHNSPTVPTSDRPPNPPPPS